MASSAVSSSTEPPETVMLPPALRPLRLGESPSSASVCMPGKRISRLAPALSSAAVSSPGSVLVPPSVRPASSEPSSPEGPPEPRPIMAESLTFICALWAPPPVVTLSVPPLIRRSPSAWMPSMAETTVRTPFFSSASSLALTPSFAAVTSMIPPSMVRQALEAMPLLI